MPDYPPFAFLACPFGLPVEFSVDIIDGLRLEVGPLRLEISDPALLRALADRATAAADMIEERDADPPERTCTNCRSWEPRGSFCGVHGRGHGETNAQDCRMYEAKNPSDGSIATPAAESCDCGAQPCEECPRP